MIPLRNRVLQCRFGQRLTLTQKPTQAAIDKSGMRTRGRRPLGRFNGLIHKCESLVRAATVSRATVPEVPERMAISTLAHA